MFLSSNCDYLFKNVNHFILFNGERLFYVRCEVNFHIYSRILERRIERNRGSCPLLWLILGQILIDVLIEFVDIMYFIANKLHTWKL